MTDDEIKVKLEKQKQCLFDQVDFLQKALATIADEPCLWLEENFNSGVSCRKQSWPSEDEDEVYKTTDWCSVCIAKAALEHFNSLNKGEN